MWSQVSNVISKRACPSGIYTHPLLDQRRTSIVLEIIENLKIEDVRIAVTFLVFELAQLLPRVSHHLLLVLGIFRGRFPPDSVVDHVSLTSRGESAWRFVFIFVFIIVFVTLLVKNVFVGFLVVPVLLLIQVHSSGPRSLMRSARASRAMV
jgi:hypothetical protein